MMRIGLVGTRIRSRYSGKEIVAKPEQNAFVFITTDSNSSSLVIEDLRKIDGVKEVYPALGAYNIVAKVSCESFDHLREIVRLRIGKLSNIKSTSTLTLT
jgi:DNA-binding Lrp family transcriptional regulator